RTVLLQPLPGHHQPEPVQARERRQIRGREGSVKHVEVFQTRRVGTLILGRPRPSPRPTRRPSSATTYTLNCEEPGTRARRRRSCLSSRTWRARRPTPRETSTTPGGTHRGHQPTATRPVLVSTGGGRR